MPPGWYDDPWTPTGLRWWDGTTWTPYTAARGFAVPQQPVAMPHTIQGSAHTQVKWRSWARVGVVVSAVLICLAYVILAVVLAHLRHHHFFTTDDNGTVTVNSDTNGWPNYVGYLPSVLEVPFIGWLFTSATLSHNLGMPAARKPMWAILGYLVPVVNLWFPYQVARDLFPPGDPQRRLAGRWWTWTLIGQLGILPVAIVSFFSLTVGLCLAAVGVVVVALGARAAVVLIDAATATLQRLAGR